ncbi:oligopeptide transport system substrate-binding protein [Marininema mesophilum]|uniref:Oligopeptide transport system substrate-binding protein n=1 Tax=Marininema mesophilum TaxID=1048340 RepID=A0A1H3A0J2_9BACL|nr:peptide ABC transporter substrate-binding protein [Marininema mesophilum]SDX23292.1 oligopeptide transport system substrate-binding protein [Marininema mesophilum]
MISPVKWLATILVCILALTACTSGEKEATSTSSITLNAQTEPPSLDPALAIDTTSGWILDHLFEGLYKKDARGRVVKGVAEKVKVAKDGKTYIFSLKKNARWSDGSPLKAKDFEYAWKRVLSPKTASQFAIYLYYLKGGEAYNKGKGTAEDVGVKATGAHTLKVTLENPVAYFPELLTFWVTYPVKEKVVNQHPKNWFASAQTLVSNGAYQLKEWKHNERVIATKNPYYEAKKGIAMERIRWEMVDDSKTAYQMFKTKKLDVVTDLPADLLVKEKRSEEYKSTPYFGTYMYMLNVKKKPFTNVKIRKAFNLAIDRESLVKHVTRGGQKPAMAFVPYGFKTPTKGDFRQEERSYLQEDVKKARQLLKEGMKEEGWSKLPPIEITYNTDENHKAIAEAVQGMVKKNLGVDVKLTNQEWKVYLNTLSQKDYQMARMGWTGVIVDPVVFLDYYLGDSPNNQTGWVNKKYDHLMMQAKQEQNEENRLKLLHQAEGILMKDLPFIPIYYYSQNGLVQSDWENIVFRTNRNPDVRWATQKK